jgi:prepilin peptidase CpaA
VTTDLLFNAILLAVLAVATTIDIRERRIPNLLTFSAIGVGIGLHLALGGLDGLKQSAQGTGVGFAMLFPLFFMRWMGAGDVKLMMAIGALKGPEFVWFAALWAAVFGGAWALIGLLRSQRLGLALAHLYFSRLGTDNVGGSFMKGVWRMPYAPAITMGALVAMAGVRYIGVFGH